MHFKTLQISCSTYICDYMITGDFYQRPKESLQPGERAKPIRQGDNLHPEGQFYDRPQQAAPLKGDRADIRKPQDNLRPEGDFYQKPKEQVTHGERAVPVRQSDNLFPEGQFYERPQQAAPLKGDRAEVRKPQDNLKPEGLLGYIFRSTIHFIFLF